MLTENLLYYIWQYKQYEVLNLKSTDNEAIKVLHCGQRNEHQGPDYSMAKVIIDGTEWIGQVEIHVKSSDWHLHHHHTDKAYDTTILHVVHTHDKDIFRTDGSKIPTLELKNHLNDSLINKYEALMALSGDIPCAKYIPNVPSIVVSSMLERMAFEKLQSKTEEIYLELAENKNNWDDTFYLYLMRSFGFKVNSSAMERLARSLPQKIFAQHKDNLHQIEALLYGQAGMLKSNFEDEYPNKLRKEYTYLAQKYSLVPLEASAWKYLRMRPPNFPTIRLAQVASLVHRSSHLFSTVLETTDIEPLKKLLSVGVSDYWQSHYVWDKESTDASKNLSQSTIELLIINTVVVFLYAYGQKNGLPEYTDRSIEFLEKISAEKNNIIDYFKEIGVKSTSALESQGQLFLHKNYCNEKKCLNCGIGVNILNHA